MTVMYFGVLAPNNSLQAEGSDGPRPDRKR